ncbi:class A beta-lactamase-related serine hydrolase [Ktedonosporobacter rubrisoli]|uniref:Class A beta-lactamase-related serine hydrolase n=1 Tax=Ktedonosporobacter rubrisoli TaxID=2509675 RepID=A0A4P6JM72_KTERU|nr:serine hydrolase domain-containing protein [Ktedonosporobacter rubrisoli]QBD76387.1 class A beta-lactamase-related serine hydrolase [Ktedonosporobacter rubrisoli]
MKKFWPFAAPGKKLFVTYMQTYARLKKFSGTVLLARGEEIHFLRAYGLACYELDVPNSPDTIFQLGSLSKPFTATAILQLQDAGRLHVTDTLATYFPDYPHGQEIKLHHLLSNTSGITDYLLLPEFRQFMGRQTTLEELLASFREQPLEFAPGERFSYSNSNWLLLGAIIERISGLSYNAFLQKHQFQPLGLTHTGYEEINALIKCRAAGYFQRGMELVRAEYDDPTALYAAGGLHSTAEEVFRWIRAVYRGRLLSIDARQQMFRPQAASGEADQFTYGYGCEIGQSIQHPSIGHSGAIHGYQTIAKHFTEDDLTVVVLSNMGNVNVPEIATALAAIAFGEPYTLPQKHTSCELDLATIADYEGTYKGTYGGRTTQMSFYVEEGKFWMHVPPLAKSEVFAISATKYFTHSKGEVELSFIKNTQGKVESIEMNWSGYSMIATRIR